MELWRGGGEVLQMKGERVSEREWERRREGEIQH